MTDDVKNVQPQLDELISINEAAELSGLSISLIRRLVGDGRIWGKKIGRNWVTTEAAIRDYMALERKPGRKPKKR